MIRLRGDPLPQESDVRCLACGDDLYFLPDSYPLVFHCQNGHFLTVKDLLDEFLPQEQTLSPPALELWTRKSQLLHQLAARALRIGHAFVAADFQETAAKIDCWIAQLRTLLPKSGAPALAPRPKERDGSP